MSDHAKKRLVQPVLLRRPPPPPPHPLPPGTLYDKIGLTPGWRKALTRALAPTKEEG